MVLFAKEPCTSVKIDRKSKPIGEVNDMTLEVRRWRNAAGTHVPFLTALPTTFGRRTD